jgi:hypothetical protein
VPDGLRVLLNMDEEDLRLAFPGLEPGDDVGLANLSFGDVAIGSGGMGSSTRRRTRGSTVRSQSVRLWRNA